MIEEHLQRVKDGVKNVYGVTTLAPWISKNTFINNKRYSFKNYEYQLDILQDEANTTITVKPAQVGVSELSYRYAVALCCTQDDFTIIYTFPSSSDAEKNNRTRIDPMIEASPEVKRLVNPNMNNSEMKQFGRNSFLFFKGTKSETQALSTPANCLIHDEFDKSDITQTSVYISRLQNKPHKLRKIFSTPTIEKYGVSKEAETAKRFRQIHRCNNCSHLFMPDYFEHIKIPGWDKPLDEITKTNLHTIKWKEARLLCPKCGQDPEFHASRMEFVCENPHENHEAHAYYVTPFSVPSIISIPYLIDTSTKYERYSEFKNQALGLTGEEKDEAILASDIDRALVRADLKTSEFHVMGGDLGLTCHILIGRESQGTFVIVHKETCHYTQYEKRTLELAAEYRVVLAVHDSQPYTDLITRICRARPNNWGAMFVNTKKPTAFTVEEAEESLEEGKMAMRLVKVNRTIALDNVLGVIKAGTWAVKSNDLDAYYKEQLLSLKRVQKFTDKGELAYVWEKTGQENDHFHFATLYLWIATKLRFTVGGVGAISANVPLISVTKGPKYGTHGNS